MENQFSRTELIIGQNSINKLQNSTVAIFGIGGVGSFTVEALARAGIGKLVLIDSDNISLSNINRQVHATHSTLDKSKVLVMKERIHDINPHIHVQTHQKFYLAETASEIFNDAFDYVVDAVDTVTAKIDLVVKSTSLNIPIISSMGTGNKIDPTQFEVADIYKTSVCPLAKVMRKELKFRNINSLKVVYSKEIPIKQSNKNDTPYVKSMTDIKTPHKRQTPGSISFVPSVAGLIIAGEVVKDLIK